MLKAKTMQIPLQSVRRSAILALNLFCLLVASNFIALVVVDIVEDDHYWYSIEPRYGLFELVLYIVHPFSIALLFGVICFFVHTANRFRILELLALPLIQFTGAAIEFITHLQEFGGEIRFVSTKDWYMQSVIQFFYTAAIDVICFFYPLYGDFDHEFFIPSNPLQFFMTHILSVTVYLAFLSYFSLKLYQINHPVA